MVLSGNSTQPNLRATPIVALSGKEQISPAFLLSDSAPSQNHKDMEASRMENVHRASLRNRKKSGGDKQCNNPPVFVNGEKQDSEDTSYLPLLSFLPKSSPSSLSPTIIKGGTCMWSCSECDQKFISNAALERHIQTHNLKTTSPVPTNLDVHQKQTVISANKTKRHFLEDIHENKRFRRSHSRDRIFSFNPDVMMHFLSNGEKVFKCDICKESFPLSNELQLKIHYLKCHINYQFLSEQDRALFSIADDVLKLARTNDLYQCYFCNVSFTQKHALVKHTAEHSRNTVLRCEVCSSVFLEPIAFSEHMQNCTKSVPTDLYRCYFCNISFAENHLLMEHASKHENADLRCETCNDVFFGNTAFSSHMKHCSNTNETSSSGAADGDPATAFCLFCKDLKTVQNTELDKATHRKEFHMYSNGLMILKCLYGCATKFKKTSVLYKHYAAVHRKVYFSCVLCKVRFESADELGAHNDKFHDSFKASHSLSKQSSSSSSSIQSCSPSPSSICSLSDKPSDKKVINEDDKSNYKKIINGQDKASCKKIIGVQDKPSYKKIINGQNKPGFKKINGQDKPGFKKIINSQDKLSYKKIISLQDEPNDKKTISVQVKSSDKKVINVQDKSSDKKVINVQDKSSDKKVINIQDESCNKKIINVQDKSNETKIINVQDKSNDKKVINIQDKSSDEKIGQEKTSDNMVKNTKIKSGPSSPSKDGNSRQKFFESIFLKDVVPKMSLVDQVLILKNHETQFPDMCKFSEIETFDPLNNKPATIRQNIHDDFVRPVFSSSQGNNVYICKACGVQLVDLKSMNKHFESEHPYIQNEYVVFEKNNVPEDFWSLHNRGLDKVTAPDIQVATTHKCTSCGIEMKNTFDFHTHLLQCSSKKQTDTNIKFSIKKRSKNERRRVAITGGVRAIPEDPLFSYKRQLEKTIRKPGDSETVFNMLNKLPSKRLVKTTQRYDALQYKDNKSNRTSSEKNHLGGNMSFSSVRDYLNYFVFQESKDRTIPSNLTLVPTVKVNKAKAVKKTSPREDMKKIKLFKENGLTENKSKHIDKKRKALGVEYVKKNFSKTVPDKSKLSKSESNKNESLGKKRKLSEMSLEDRLKLKKKQQEEEESILKLLLSDELSVQDRALSDDSLQNVNTEHDAKKEKLKIYKSSTKPSSDIQILGESSVLENVICTKISKSKLSNGVVKSHTKGLGKTKKIISTKANKKNVIKTVKSKVLENKTKQAFCDKPKRRYVKKTKTT